MCKDYSAKLENNMLEKEENNVIEYFRKAQQHKIMILHFPLLSYIAFCIM